MKLPKEQEISEFFVPLDVRSAFEYSDYHAPATAVSWRALYEPVIFYSPPATSSVVDAEIREHGRPISARYDTIGSASVRTHREDTHRRGAIEEAMLYKSLVATLFQSDMRNAGRSLPIARRGTGCTEENWPIFYSTTYECVRETRKGENLKKRDERRCCLID